MQHFEIDQVEIYRYVTSWTFIIVVPYALYNAIASCVNTSTTIQLSIEKCAEKK